MEESANKDKYAIILGKGDLAQRIVNVAKEKKIDFVIAGVKGYSSGSVVKQHQHFWFYLGQVEDLLQNLKQHNVTKIILVGSIKRPSLWALRVDKLGRAILSQYMNRIGGDDTLLSMIINKFEERGFKVVGAQEIDQSILAIEKNYTKVMPSPEYNNLILKGFAIAKHIGDLDIGQSIIFQQNMVIAVEAVEGTDAMISRSKKILKKVGSTGALGGILIKVKKSYQDNRVDLPTIGDKTVKQAYKAGLKGIAIEAHSTIILNEVKTIALANKYGIFITAITNKN